MESKVFKIGLSETKQHQKIESNLEKNHKYSEPAVISKKRPESSKSFEIRLDNNSALFKNSLNHSFFNTNEPNTKKIFSEKKPNQPNLMTSQNSPIKLSNDRPKFKVVMEQPKEPLSIDVSVDVEDYLTTIDEIESVSYVSITSLPQRSQTEVQTTNNKSLSIDSISSIHITPLEYNIEKEHILTDDNSFATVVDRTSFQGNNPEYFSSQPHSRSYTPTHDRILSPFSLDSTLLYHGTKENNPEDKDVIRLFNSLQIEIEKLKHVQTETNAYKEISENLTLENKELKREILEIKKQMALKCDIQKVDKMFEQKQDLVETAVDIIQKIRQELNDTKSEISVLKDVVNEQQSLGSNMDKKFVELLSIVNEFTNMTEVNNQSDATNKLSLDLDILKESNRNVREELKFIKESLYTSSSTPIQTEYKESNFKLESLESYINEIKESKYEQLHEPTKEHKVRTPSISLIDLYENKAIINDLQNKLKSLEAEKRALEDEFINIPDTSRSMKSKKRKQTIEQELSINSACLSSIRSKIKKYSSSIS